MTAAFLTSPPSSFGPSILWTTVATAAVMIALWLIHLRTRNGALVDFGWSLCLGLSAIAQGVWGEAPLPRRILLATIVGLWSARLTHHVWVERIWKQEEEARYQALRRRWGERAAPLFLLFFLAQALLVGILTIPFVLVAHNPTPALSPTDLAALVLFPVAFALEWLADAQLARFRKTAPPGKRICDQGLWAWSRNPNYFFEVCQWVAFALPAIGAPGGWLAWIGPGLILLFVTKITGIPPKELHMRRTRGEAWERYAQRTSRFVPWPPRREAEETS